MRDEPEKGQDRLMDEIIRGMNENTKRDRRRAWKTGKGEGRGGGEQEWSRVALGRRLRARLCAHP